MDINLFEQESIIDFLQKTPNIDEKFEMRSNLLKNRNSNEKGNLTQTEFPLSIHCIAEGSLEGLRTLISAGCSTAPLLQASIFFDKQKIFDFLIQMEINVNSIDENLETPLLAAVRKGILYYVNVLLEKGADPSFCDKNGYSPLYIAAELNHYDIAKLLVENRASTTSQVFELSPLHVAIKKHNIPIVFLLLQYGASTQLCAADNENLNYITDAVQEKLLDVFKCLLACGTSLPALNSGMLTSDFITCTKIGSPSPTRTTQTVLI